MRILFDQGTPVPTTNWPEIQIHGNEVAEAASRMTAGDYLEIHW